MYHVERYHRSNSGLAVDLTFFLRDNTTVYTRYHKKFYLRSVAPAETRDHEQPEDQESRWRCKYLMLRGVMSDSSG